MNIDEFKNIEMTTEYFNSIINKNFKSMKNIKFLSKSLYMSSLEYSQGALRIVPLDGKKITAHQS